MSEPNITQMLLESLREQGHGFTVELRNIEISLAALELRRAYALMAQLRERGTWHPSAEAEQALEDFWWEYGQ